MNQMSKIVLCAMAFAAWGSLQASPDWIAIGRGYETFRDRYVKRDYELLAKLAGGQQPIGLIITCVDSRVDPAVIFQATFGKFLILRNVANIVPEYASALGEGEKAALFFAVQVLKIKNVIILGHSNCGGLAHLLANFSRNPRNDYVYNWVQTVQPTDEAEIAIANAFAKAPTNTSKEIEKRETILNDYAKVALNKSYDNCLTYSWIGNGVGNGTVTLHAWYFDIGQGKIYARYQDGDGTIEYHDLASKEVFLKEFGTQATTKPATVEKEPKALEKSKTPNKA